MYQDSVRGWEEDIIRTEHEREVERLEAEIDLDEDYPL
jgi:hypothetical protein